MTMGGEFLAVTSPTDGQRYSAQLSNGGDELVWSAPYNSQTGNATRTPHDTWIRHATSMEVLTHHHAHTHACSHMHARELVHAQELAERTWTPTMRWGVS